jgi:tyrosyl-tRNA synthetase
VSILEALTGLGFCASNGEAKRKIAEGAVRIDDQVISDPFLVIQVPAEPVKVSLGKKKHGLLVS